MKVIKVKLQLHEAIYRLRFYSNSLIHILSLSNSHNNVASIQKNRGDKSHCVIVASVTHLSSLQHTRWLVRMRRTLNNNSDKKHLRSLTLSGPAFRSHSSSIVH